ncbi:PP2C family protein-serine/threonine phosphatase [Cellulomonas xylanilytica]|uniref:Phosphatase n=1 Tax=Cellulomonas xylanilytica TaxID=233583 RepID=A0A510V9L5_9CELL|nr:PP2C family protein-serine/threonine phosphatase [Cellulomonas xylanilytica]GEK23436.1 phosphatase [Cellulomonas xylanilytica]
MSRAGGATTTARQRRLIQVGLARAELTPDELWQRSFALGATIGPTDLTAYLDGSLTLPSSETDRVALAVNERLDDLHGRHRVPYVRTVRHLDRPGGPLAALTQLLRATHLAAPDTLARAVDTGAQELGVRAVAYLVDDSDEHLVPVGAGADRSLRSVEGSLAGRAYRLLETQETTVGGPRLWIPIIDGAERLGVLEVEVADPADLEDPVLRRQGWWFTHYLGHLITVLDAYGDSIDDVRRQRPREVQAELVRALLPPLTAGSDKVLISGRLEPAQAVGGDVFDYAIATDAIQFAIADATGHDLRAGLAATAALAAYRHARRQGHGLVQQVHAIDDVITEQFGGTLYATGVVASLDLDTGDLRYVNAGHPAPLLVRDGRVVKEIGRGRRSLFGLESRRTTVAEERLEPGDALVLYTDGIVEARDAAGEAFGLERFVGQLERASDDGIAIPEVLRRVRRRILEHQGGVLQDDATLLVVHWTTKGQLALEPDLWF